MKIEPKGYDVTKKRYNELRARFERMRQARPEPPPNPDPGRLQGTITNGFQPMNPMGMGATLRVSTPAPEILSMIQQAAVQNGIDPRLFEALVSAESDFNPQAVSPAGAMGLSQLMPATARGLGVTDPFDPWQNLQGGAKYLSQMMRQFGGDVRLALAAYNAGPGAVQRHGGVPPFAETQTYVERVLTRANAGGVP